MLTLAIVMLATKEGHTKKECLHSGLHSGRHGERCGPNALCTSIPPLDRAGG